MLPSIGALMLRMIDYAGLFPPARLPLDQAIRNYIGYCSGADKWILHRFVCPAAGIGGLDEFEHDLALLYRPLTISPLGRGGNDPTEFITGLRADLQALQAFTKRQRGLLGAFQVRLPAAQSKSAQTTDWKRLMAEVFDVLESTDVCIRSIFYEVLPEADWRQSLSATIDAIAAVNEARQKGPSEHQLVAGLKWRCGGLDASAFPSPEQVAFVIAACRDRGVAWKATAGLHHPFRHFDAGFNTLMHGFINVFGAAVLASVAGLSEKDIEAIIADEDASHFGFSEHGFQWRDLQASTEQIRAVRRDVALSFGSCSFEEPCSDLRSLGLL